MISPVDGWLNHDDHDDHDDHDAGGFMGKMLVIGGLVIAFIGLLVMIGVPLGRLPGDISYSKGNTRFYFPVVTCVVLSILFTIVMALLRR